MDKVDYDILKYLNKNSRSSASEISRRINMSIPAVAERIRKLEDSRTIEAYTIKVNREKSNLKLMAFINVNLDCATSIEDFRAEIVKYTAVLECHHIAGQSDYLLKVLLEDTKALENFITNKLKQIKGVRSSNTTIVLSTLKENLNVFD